MGEWKGKIVTCDKCGRECRRKLIDTTEADGGFTHVERFEEMPETWKYRYEIGYLCPECNGEYELLLQNFMIGSPQKTK